MEINYLKCGVQFRLRIPETQAEKDKFDIEYQIEGIAVNAENDGFLQGEYRPGMKSVLTHLITVNGESYSGFELPDEIKEQLDEIYPIENEEEPETVPKERLGD